MSACAAAEAQTLKTVLSVLRFSASAAANAMQREEDMVTRHTNPSYTGWHNNRGRGDVSAWILRSRVAKNLRDIRIAKGVSQEDLAHRAKLNRNYIGMLESGKNSPTVKTLEKIAQALEIDAADFFYRGHKTVADN